MNLFIVYSFTSIVDSVWDNEQLAKARAIELDKENGGDFASIHAYQRNIADGYVCAEVEEPVSEAEDEEDRRKVFVRSNTKQGQTISLEEMLAKYGE